MNEDEEGRNKALLDAIREDTEMEADDELWDGKPYILNPTLYDGEPTFVGKMSTSELKDIVFCYVSPINAHYDNCTCGYCEELIKRGERF